MQAWCFLKTASTVTFIWVQKTEAISAWGRAPRTVHEVLRVGIRKGSPLRWLDSVALASLKRRARADA